VCLLSVCAFFFRQETSAICQHVFVDGPVIEVQSKTIRVGALVKCNWSCVSRLKRINQKKLEGTGAVEEAAASQPKNGVDVEMMLIRFCLTSNPENTSTNRELTMGNNFHYLTLRTHLQ